MDKTERRIYEDCMFLVICLGMLTVSLFVPLVYAIILMGVAGGTSVFFAFDLRLAFKGKPWPSLRRDRKGIVYVWFVAAITIGFTAICWWVVSFPLFMVIEAMEATGSYPPEALATVNLVKTVLGWFLACEVFGVLVWALVSSFRREEQQYPVAP